jgi:transcriptional regulator with GAF, ATPase, and Fis domain
MHSNRRYALDLSDVQKAMVPGVKEVLKTGIGLYAGKDAFTLTAISVALDESGGNQSVAARKLGIPQSTVSNAVNGKTFTRYKKKDDPEQK